MSRLTHIHANGVDFAALELGDGPLALCLHGFPDTAHTWRHLLPRLAAAGYRAVAPFMRGYAPTGLAPDGVYSPRLADDVAALHEALGGDADAVLVGHDWGAGAVWGGLLADAARPAGARRWRRAVALSVPPLPGSLDLASPNQMRRSWYSFALQALEPADAVAAVAAEDFAFVAGLWADWSPGYDATAELAAVRAALADMAHLDAALAYYRQAPSRPRSATEQAETRARLEAIPTPVLYVHGADCGCMGLELLDLAAFPDGARVEVVQGAGHFVHLEQPEEIGELVVGFLRDRSPRERSLRR